MKKAIHRIFPLIAAALLLALSGAPAAAMTASEAKQAGLLGEQFDGYLGIPGQPTDELRALANELNIKRKAHYQDLARQTGGTLQAVEQVAGAKFVEEAPPGQYVRLPDKGWVKK